MSFVDRVRDAVVAAFYESVLVAGEPSPVIDLAAVIIERPKLQSMGI